MAVQIAPRYQQFFGPQASELRQWDDFSHTERELLGVVSFEDMRPFLSRPLSERAVDFSVNDPANYIETATRVFLFVLKIVIFPWGLYELTRYVVQRLIMIPLYPAQSNFVTNLAFENRSGQLLALKRARSLDLIANNYRVREVTLEKNGVRYQGIMVGHQSTIDNGKWALQATGNLEPIETSFASIARIYQRYGYNTLLVNGPAVSLSEGQAVPKTMGDAQEVGLRFLEEAIHAQTMLVAGRSLGGAAIGQMTSGHRFLQGRSYVVASQMTFDKVSHIAREFVREIFPLLTDYASAIIRWAGLEIDAIRASRRLAHEHIPQIVIQACLPPLPGALRVVVNDGFKQLGIHDEDQVTDDGVIPGSVGLARTLIEQEITARKHIWGLERLEDENIHNSNMVIEQTARIASGLQTDQLDQPAVIYRAVV